MYAINSFQFIPKLLFTSLFCLFAGGLQAQGPAKVVLGEVGERLITPTTQYSGVLRFDRVAHISPEVEGLITHMRLTDGLKVEKGDEIARLSTDFLDQDRIIAEAEIAEAQARIEQKATELKRLKTLRKEAAASRSAYDEALYEHKALLAREKMLQQRVERLRLQARRSIIRAPFQGIVLERLQDVGEWARPNNALGRIASTDQVLAIFAIPQYQVLYQRKNTELDIHIPALNKTLKGTSAGFVSDAEVRALLVYLKIEIPYEQGMLENLSVEARIPSGEARNLRMIPRDALLRQPGPATVYTVEDGKAKAVTFGVALREGDEIGTADTTIFKGMNVVIDGNERLKPGQDVEIVKAIGTGSL